MKKIILGVICVLFGMTFFSSFVLAQEKISPKPVGGKEGAGQDAVDPNACDPKKDIMLNTNIPFVGRCIKKSTTDGGTNAGNVFPKLMGSMTRIVMAVVVIVGFLGILVGGFMISAGGVKADLVSKGKGLIIKVIAGLALVGMSGVILNLVNPSFFKTGNTSTESGNSTGG